MSKAETQIADAETEESMRDTARDDLDLSDLPKDREPDIVIEETVEFPDGQKATRTELDAEPEGSGKPDKLVKREGYSETKEKRRQPPPTEQERHEIRSARRSEREALSAKEQAEREAALLRQANEGLMSRLDRIEERLGPGEAEKDTEELKSEDFDDYDQYVEARVERAVQKALKESGPSPKDPDPLPAESKDEDTEPSQFKTAVERLGAAWNDGKEIYEDFDKVMEPVHKDDSFPMTEPLVVALSQSDNPVELGYYLAQNREEAKRLSALQPMKLAIELGRLEGRIDSLSGIDVPGDVATEDAVEDVAESPAGDVQTVGDIHATERTDKKPKARATQAPKPIRPLGGATKPMKNPDNMSQSEYAAARRTGKL